MWALKQGHLTTSTQLSQRNCAAGWVSCSKKWKTGTGRQYLRTLGLYSSTVAHLVSKAIEFGEKTQNKGYYAVQGHSRSSRSEPIESPYVTSYKWLIVTDNLSRTVAELSQLIFQSLDTLRFWATLWRLRDNVRYSILGSLESAQRTSY